MLDLWDAIEDDVFTDSAVHMTPAGVQTLSELVGPAVVGLAGKD